MKSKIQLTILTLALLLIGFLGGNYAPIDKDKVTIQRTKQGLFLIMDGNLYTVSKLVTDTDTYQKIDRIK